MKNINIAVIDTGVDINSIYNKKNIIIDKKIQPDYFEKSVSDENGHGTCCINTILMKSKNINIFPVKIYNEEGRTSSYFLLEALEKLIPSNIDLINISASSENCSCENEMNLVCDELNRKGKVVICSQSNNYMCKPCIPTKFKSVIGVNGDEKIFKDEHYFYSKDREFQISGNSKYRLIKGLNGHITDFGGNSRLSSIITGEVANIMIEIGSKNLEQIENKLIEKSLFNEKVKNNITNLNYRILMDNITKNYIINNILDVINDNFAIKTVDISLLEKYFVFNESTNINKHNAYNFLSKINNKFKIEIDYRSIYLYELANINLLVNLIASYI
jgi:hypothetical protein